jgi:hypothetical protein
MNGVDLERLAEVEARVAAATPGAWYYYGDEICGVAAKCRCPPTHPGNALSGWSMQGEAPHEAHDVVIGTTEYDADGQTVPDFEEYKSNLKLIAHAPADLAWLAAELRAALAALHDLREESAAYQRGLRDGAEQELARVKGVLEEEARFNTRLVPLYDKPASGEFRACVAALYAVIPRLDPPD